jgi:hypothetical protein
MGQVNSTINPVKEMQPFVDMVLALKYFCAQLTGSLIKWSEIRLEKDDEAALTALELKKQSLVRKIRRFIQFLSRAIDSLDRAAKKGQDWIFDAEQTVENVPFKSFVQQTSDECFALSAEYGALVKIVANKYRSQIIFKKFMGALAVTAAAIGAALLVFFTCGAAIPVVAGVIGAAALVTAGAVTGYLVLSDSESERAIAYLTATGENLRAVGKDFDDLRNLFSQGIDPITQAKAIKHFHDHAMTVIQGLDDFILRG